MPPASRHASTICVTRRKFLRSTATIAIGAALPVELWAAAGKAEPIERSFAAPGAAFHPWTRWWWPGTDVEPDQLRREIRLMADAGFGGAEIQPLLPRPRPEGAALAAMKHFPEPSYFGNVRTAAIEAGRAGMQIDLTFGSGWPFGGGPQVTPELAQVEMRHSRLSVTGPARLATRLMLPSGIDDANTAGLDADWVERLRRRETTVAVIAARGDEPALFPLEPHVGDKEPLVHHSGTLDFDTVVDLSDRVSAQGDIAWDVPEGSWQIFLFRQVASPQRMSGAFEGPGLVLDHLKAAAFAAYADWIGPPLEKALRDQFGRTIRAIFCDSLELKPELYWTDDFRAEFLRRRGYDLLPYLPLVLQRGRGKPFGGYLNKPYWDDAVHGEQVRADYWRTISDLMLERFFRPFADWAKARGLLSRMQAHGGPQDLIAGYASADIPEAEHQFDNGRYDFLKMVSSAAHLHGRKIVSNESFAWLGRAYRTTPELLKRYGDELITAGINQIVYHGYPYDYPRERNRLGGWSAFGTAFSDPIGARNPYWPYLKRLNDYFARLQMISREGIPVAPVALFRDVLAYEEILPPREEPPLNGHLLAAGYDFDHINAGALAACRSEGGKLVAPSGATYAVILVDDQASLSAEVIGTLTGLARQGVAVVLSGRVPTIRGRVSPGDPTVEALLTCEQVIHAPVPEKVGATLSRLGIAPNLRFEGASLPFMQRAFGSRQVYFVSNPSAGEKSLRCVVPGADAVELWDPWTGRITPLASTQRDGGSAVSVKIDAYGSLLLATSERKALAKVEAARKLAELVPVGLSGWTLEALPYEAAKPRQTVALARLEDWRSIDSLRYFSGKGVYRTSLTLEAGQLAKGRTALLDLGQMTGVAEVRVNGTPLPALLMRPYRIDIGRHLRLGSNAIEIAILSTMHNAIFEKPEPYGRFVVEASLTPEGLVGPVTLLIMAGA